MGGKLEIERGRETDEMQATQCAINFFLVAPSGGGAPDDGCTRHI